MPLNLIVLYLVAIINLLLAAFVVFRNPKSWVNRSFFLFVGALSFWTISVSMLSYAKTMIWSDLSLFLGDLVGISFILFAKFFPEGKPVSWKFAFWTFILPASLFIVLAPFRPFVSGIIIKGDEIQPVIGPLYIPLMIWLTISPLIGGYILFRKFRKYTGYQKNQLKFLFYGFFIFISMVTISNVIFPSLGIGKYAFIGPYFSLIMVASTSYAIVKHRFLDIRLVVARAIAYLLLILFIGSVYSATLFNLAYFFISNNSRTMNIATSTALALIFAMSFQPLLRFFEKITDRFFYRDKYDSNEVLREQSHIMASTLYLSDLCKKILEDLISSMKISYGTIVVIRKSAIIWSSSAGTSSRHPFKGKDIYTLVHKARHSGNNEEQMLVYEELPESSIKKIMREHNITIVLPLVVRDQVIGGLILGEKSSGEIYSSADIGLLKILAPEIAIAVRNALSFEEIKHFNITLEEEIKRATERLRKANHRLKELDNLKDEFVSIASHELRTPMTAVKSYLWMALNQPGQELKPTLKKYLDISYASTERLIRLVNDMLTVSRIERNKIELKMAVIDIFEILEAVYNELKVTADQNKIHFTLNRSDDKPYLVKADKEKLREVFQNIVGNALKFTPKDGTIKIDIARKGNIITTAVSDTGPGIPKESMGMLFQKFGKIDYSYAKHSNQPGTGLGLYISKQIVSLHNGDIGVQSEVNVGTTFTVLLPAAQADAK